MTTAKKTPPVKAGDRITWSQYSQSGAGWVAAYERTGTVWDGAPIDSGVYNAWWVVPDQPGPGDCYHAVYVGRASTRNPYYSEGPAKGEVYSSRQIQDVTSIMTVGAWRAAQAVKAARQASRAGYATAA